jgi:hypothetical protein
MSNIRHPEFLGTLYHVWRFWASYWCSAPKIFVAIEHTGSIQVQRTVTTGAMTCQDCGALHLTTPYSHGSTKIRGAMHLNHKIWDVSCLPTCRFAYLPICPLFKSTSFRN